MAHLFTILSPCQLRLVLTSKTHLHRLHLPSSQVLPTTQTLPGAPNIITSPQVSLVPKCQIQATALVVVFTTFTSTVNSQRLQPLPILGTTMLQETCFLMVQLHFLLMGPSQATFIVRTCLVCLTALILILERCETAPINFQ